MSYDALLNKIKASILNDSYNEMELFVNQYLTKLQEDGTLNKSVLLNKEVQ